MNTHFQTIHHSQTINTLYQIMNTQTIIITHRETNIRTLRIYIVWVDANFHNIIREEPNQNTQEVKMNAI